MTITVWHDQLKDTNLIQELLYTYSKIRGIEFQNLDVENFPECELDHEFDSEKLAKCILLENLNSFFIAFTQRPLNNAIYQLTGNAGVLISTFKTSFDERAVCRMIYSLITARNTGTVINSTTLKQILTTTNFISLMPYSLKRIPEFIATLGKLTYNDLPSSSYALITHGIRTFGDWTEPASCRLTKYNISSSIHRYGWIDSINFAFNPYARKKDAEELLFKINTAIVDNPRKRISIIAHSFGTIVLINALKKAEQLGIRLDIDAVILNGSIIKQNFRWRNYTQPDKPHGVTIRRVLNICGDKDQYPVIAKYFVYGAGDSGSAFFTNSLDHNVSNIRLLNVDHNSILSEVYADSIWGPYILQKDTIYFKLDEAHPVSLKIKLWNYGTLLFLIASVGLGLGLGLNKLLNL